MSGLGIALTAAVMVLGLVGLGVLAELGLGTIVIACWVVWGRRRWLSRAGCGYSCR